MSIVLASITIIAYGALLAIGFALGKEITYAFAQLWLKGRDKVVAWDLKRNNFFWSDLNLA